MLLRVNGNGNHSILIMQTALLSLFTNKSLILSPFHLGKKSMQKGFMRLTKQALIGYLIAFITFSSITGLFLFNPWSTKTADAAWFNDNWGYRKEIPVTANTGVDTNTYISFSLDTATLITAGQLQSSCQDIRVTDVGGNILAYHVGRTNACNNAATTIDALVPTLGAGASTFYVYYGNPAVTSKDAGALSQSEASTYTVGSLVAAEKAPSPVAYWKFDEGQGTSVKDSSINGITGTTVSQDWIAEDRCISGKCLYSDGNNGDRLTFSDSPVIRPSLITITGWIRLNSQSGNYRIIDKVGEIYSFNLETAVGSLKTLRMRLTDSNGGNHDIESNTGIPMNEWVYIAGTYDGSIQKLYINGTLQSATSSWSGILEDTSGITTIGSDVTYNNTMVGFIDEFKIFNFALPANQIQANYNARSNPEGVSAALGANTQNMPGALSDGLVGYWKMDEASWTNDCSTTSVTDSSGNGNNGKACPNSTGPTGGAAGKFGNAGSFDGSNDYVGISSSSLRLTGDMTVSMWMKTSDTSEQQLFSKDNDGGTGGWGLRIVKSNGFVYASYVTTNPSIVAGSAALVPFTNGSWTHVVVTYKDGQYLNVFINGVQGSSSTVTGTSLRTSDQDHTIGYWVGGSYFTGSIDETRVYNRALSGAEVSQLYNWAPGPIAEYKFDDKTGTNAVDSSGNGNNATLVNMASPATALSGWNPGKYGSSVAFDNTNDYVNAGSATITDDVSIKTIETWVKLRSTPGGLSRIIEKIGSAGYLLGIQTSNQIDFQQHFSGGTAEWQSPSNVVPNNVWTHVAVAYDRTGTNAPTIYVNGVSQTITTTTPASGTAQSDASGNMILGNRDAADRTLDGFIDDFKIYNYARTQGQVVEDLNANHPAPGSPVSSAVAHWKLDEGYGTSAGDYSGQANTLTLSTATSAWTNSGKFNKAWGGLGTNWLSRADDDDFDIGAGDSYSVSMWFKSTSATNPGSNEYLIAKGTNSAAGYAMYAAINGVVCFAMDDDTTWGPDDSLCTNGDIYDATWHHIVVVKTALTRLELYVDGKIQSSFLTSFTATATLANSASLYIGDRDGTDNGSEFNGTIDEIKVYRSALTAEQVKLDMNHSSSQVLGAMGATSNTQPNATANEYCPPDSATSACAGPLVEWKFDEGSGSTANDTSGNGNSGSILSSVPYSNGKINKALNFAGTSTQSVASTYTTHVPLITAEVWAYSTSISGTRTMVSKNHYTGSNNGFYLRESSANVQCGVQNGGTDYITTDFASTLNTWVHYACSFDGSNIRVYKNGVLMATTASAAMGSNAGAINAGAGYGDGFGGNERWIGKLDQVRFYNYVRTPAQIVWSYNKGGPIAHWKMDECQGTVINDMSGNSYTGTWSGSGGGNTSAGTCQTASTAWGDGATGKRNYSLDFDGTDDDVTVTGLLGSQQNLTLSAWVNLSAIDTSGAEILSIGDYVSIRADDTSSNDTAGYFYNGSVYTATDSDVNIVGTGWRHVAYTFTSGLQQIYIDGLLKATTAIAGPIVYTGAGSNTKIGEHGNASANYNFNGKIDDVKVHNYPLTATQIKTLYNDGVYRTGPSTGAP